MPFWKNKRKEQVERIEHLAKYVYPIIEKRDGKEKASVAVYGQITQEKLKLYTQAQLDEIEETFNLVIDQDLDANFLLTEQGDVC